VVHVEAGLRSGDRRMPEEINRMLTDQHLRPALHHRAQRAGQPAARRRRRTRVLRGNVMIDSLLSSREAAAVQADTLRAARPGPRAAGSPAALRRGHAAPPVQRRRRANAAPLLARWPSRRARLPLVFAMHPRTRSNIERFGLAGLARPGRMRLLPPQGYLEMLGLMAGATLVLTDSGGLQEETTALGVPCLTLRENTERPITVEQGTNTVVGRDRKAILRCVTTSSAGRGKRGRVPEYWDGHAAERIAADLHHWLRARTRRAFDEPHARPRHHQRADRRRGGLLPGLGARALHPRERVGQRAAASSATSIASWPCWTQAARGHLLHAGLDRRALSRHWCAHRRGGHELASHGYGHERASDLDREFPSRDIARAKALLEDIGGVAVKGYRAPSFSIGTATCGRFDTLARPATATARASTRSSTTTTACPTRRASRYRVARRPAGSAGDHGAHGRAQPASSGGGYFRLLPYAVSRWMLRA
jgi:peptidoglycan/xylan/chitin deacetylase (PgdA/CDA1 family)